MGVNRFWILCFFFDFLVTYAASSPPALHVLPYLAKRSDGSSMCEEKEVFKVNYAFHECFIDRKYNDGGRDLNFIVDRILEHGEACIETASRDCRPDFKDFIDIMNKMITQMKDYAQMYLEAIYKGREKVKDLDCVESILDIKTYQRCFRNVVPLGHNESEATFEKAVAKGIACANTENMGCSVEAKTTFNRIVRVILGVEQPAREEFEDTKPTEAPEGPWMWYDYLAYPFVMAWRGLVSLFSG